MVMLCLVFTVLSIITSFDRSNMRSTLLLSTLALLANAAPHPRPQGIDLDVVQAAPQPTDVIDSSTTTGEIVTFDSESAISAIIASVISGDDEAVVDISNSTSDPIPDTNLERRAALRARTACATQIVGYGPVPSPDTPAVFSSYSAYASAALNAPTPSGYKSIYTNMNASNNAPAYLGYTTLKSYDTVLLVACPQHKFDPTNACSVARRNATQSMAALLSMSVS